jgi:hypothetical protein
MQYWAGVRQSIQQDIQKIVTKRDIASQIRVSLARVAHAATA